jgi:hypothetical protein
MDTAGSEAGCAGCAGCTVTLESVSKCIRSKFASASTVRSYLDAINSVIRANPDAPSLGHALVSDHKRTFEALKCAHAHLKEKSLLTRISGVMGTFKVSEQLQQVDDNGLAREFWGGILKDMREKERLRAQDNTITPEQLKNSVPLEEVLAAARTLDHWSLKQSQDKVLLSLAALVPAKRADWGGLRIVAALEDAQADENALVVTSESIVLVLNKYKTAKDYGQYVEEISGEAADVIRTSLAEHPRTHLFLSPRKKGMTNDAFSTYVSDCFDRHMRKHITVDLLRHMWVTQRVDQRRMTVGECAELAHKMLHSLEQQKMYFMVQ